MTTGNEYWRNFCSAWPRHAVQDSPAVLRSTKASLKVDKKAARALYREPHGPDLNKGSSGQFDTDREAIQRFMESFEVAPELISTVLAKYDELMESTPARGAGRMYRWSSANGRKRFHHTFETRSILALINALTYSMPEPVQAIRHKLVHEKRESSVYFDYDDTVQAYMRFVNAIVVPYAVRKIRALERQFTGQVYERSLHRTTDMGQGGRRFSDADTSDLIDRVIIATFCPLYCRLLPLTDKGKAYVMVKSCTGISIKAGEKEFITRTGVQALQKLDKMVKLLRKRKITEQEYTEFLSKFKIPKIGKTTERNSTMDGYWVTLKCNQTGQLFKVFTQSAAKADDIMNMTSFRSEVDRVIPANPAEFTELNVNSLYPYSVDGSFFRTLKGMTRSLYRFLMRRTDYDDQMITEHRESRRLRKNPDELFSLKEVQDEHSDILTTVQKDIISAELSMDIVPPRIHRNNRRVWMYNRTVEARTGVNPELTRYKYEQLRAVEFHCIGVRLGLIDSTAEQVIIHEDDSESVVYKNPVWIKERADRVQLTSFETAFAVQSGLDKSTPHWPAPVSVSRLPYFVYDEIHGMVYVSPTDPPAVYLNAMSGGNSYKETVQLTPVQYPVLSRPMARHVAAVRAISGPMDVENPTCKGVQLDEMTVNGFKVPVWTTEQESYVQEFPRVEIFTSGEWFNETYGITVPCGQQVMVDKKSPSKPFMKRITVQAYYTDVCTASGDGI